MYLPTNQVDCIKYQVCYLCHVLALFSCCFDIKRTISFFCIFALFFRYARVVLSFSIQHFDHRPLPKNKEEEEEFYENLIMD